MSSCTGRAARSSPYGFPSWPTPLDHILVAMERGQGMPLSALDRKAKQEVVRVLEARGAFSVRHGVETVAGALGVSRFTVYNYLNRENAAKGSRSPSSMPRCRTSRRPDTGRRLLSLRVFNKVLTWCFGGR